MNSVTVNRKVLLEKLKTNRAAHRDLFLKAQVGYREQVIKELDRMLADARTGGVIQRVVSLPEPHDHTDDYDNAIAMLEMSVDEQLEITAHEFNMYVMDKWGWKAASDTVSAMYIAAAK